MELERKVVRLIVPPDGQARWMHALQLLNDALEEAGEDRGQVLYLKAVVLWRKSVSNVRYALSLIDDALPLLAGDPVGTVRALLDGCLMAELSRETDRHRIWAKQLRQISADSIPALAPWQGLISTNQGIYWSTTGDNRLRAAASFREAVSFFTRNTGPFDDRNRLYQLRHAHSLLGDVLLSLGRHQESSEQYRLARRLKLTGDNGDAGRSAVCYLEGRLAHLEGRVSDAITAYREGIRLTEGNPQDHRMIISLVEALCELHRDHGELGEVRSLAIPLVDQYTAAGIPQVVLRLQQLASPVAGEEVVV